jgi:hypothetical protein
MWPNKEGQKTQNELVSNCKHTVTISKAISTLLEILMRMN